MTDPPTPSDDDPSPRPVHVDRATLQATRRRERKKQRRKWPKRIAIGLGIVVLLIGMIGAAGYVYVNYRFGQIRKIHAKHLKVSAPGKPFNILLVGSDTRSFVTNGTQIRAFGSSSTEGGQRSDVTIIARVIPATRQVYLLSIPRDLWVDIPGKVSGVSGLNRINAAFNNGPDLLIQTIERVLHIPINHYVSVNFPGFQGMVDALGGITMNFPAPVRDPMSGLDVMTTGCQLVNGPGALELVRSRHLSYRNINGYWEYDGLSDFSRIQRQDAFFRAVLAKANSEITNPFALNSFIGAAVKNLTIDDTLTAGELFSLAREFHGVTQANLHTTTLPTYGFVTAGGADVLGEAQPYANQTLFEFNLLGTGNAKTPAGQAPRQVTPPSTTTTSTTTTQPIVAPQFIQVKVLDGSGPGPVASGAAAKLRPLGFAISTIGDAASYTYATTEIEYGTGGIQAAQMLASHLSGTTKLVPTAGLQGNELTLIVGKSFTGVSANPPASPGGNGAAGGPAGTTTTTLRPTTTTLPAIPPGGSASTPTSTTTSTSTTTTIPGDVYTNTQPEPWNPQPC